MIVIEGHLLNDLNIITSSSTQLVISYQNGLQFCLFSRLNVRTKMLVPLCRQKGVIKFSHMIQYLDRQMIQLVRNEKQTITILYEPRREKTGLQGF